MPDKPILGEETLDADVLACLCEAAPWTEAELERELGRGTRDALGRVVARGLAHQMDGGLIFASVAGRYAHSLDPTWLS